VKRNYLYFLVIVVGFVLTYAAYNLSNYGYYSKATGVINKNKVSEERKKLEEGFYASDKDYTYGGILAGVLLNRVGVWGRDGLRFFNVDKYSAYHFIDACSPTAMAKNPEIEYPTNKFVYYRISDWQKNLSAGDYVVVMIAHEGNGGTAGNLREIYAYNYWPFIQKDIKTECAK